MKLSEKTAPYVKNTRGGFAINLSGRSFLDNDLGIGRVLLNGFNTVGAASHCFVAFAYSDYLAVSCLQAETILAGFIEIDFKLRVLLNRITFFCLIFYGSNRSIFLYAGILQK